jgi:hypothetical protein
MTMGSDVWSCGRGARTVVTSFNQVSWEVSCPFLSICLFCASPSRSAHAFSSCLRERPKLRRLPSQVGAVRREATTLIDTDDVQLLTGLGQGIQRTLENGVPNGYI